MQRYLNELGIVAWQQRQVVVSNTKVRITLIGETLTAKAQSLLNAILNYLNVNTNAVEIINEPMNDHTNPVMVIALPDRTITTRHPADLLTNPLDKKKVMMDLL